MKTLLGVPIAALLLAIALADRSLRFVLRRGELQAHRLRRAGVLWARQAALLYGDEDLPQGRVRPADVYLL